MTFKGGAPRKEEDLKLKYRMKLNFNLEEFNLIKSKSLYSNKILKDIILQAILNNSINISTDKDPKYNQELNKIGINLNQIVKKANSIKELSNSDIQKMIYLMDVIQKKILHDS
ncbi:mobilization protein MobC [Flavobacterium limicola]|uniref:Mobilization protein MobC n=1 Tax=Flavobacterium limicola TaxID=180441 RepID=A0A495S2E3_9FLAO|nr:plasmid mobilization relaxosome protein MobC [Flavobacterium limicola]RKS93830.1 mobilization protein MobC [Flavobacterium limicola]